jgi:hypothetical protein
MCPLALQMEMFSWTRNVARRASIARFLVARSPAAAGRSVAGVNKLAESATSIKFRNLIMLSSDCISAPVRFAYQWQECTANCHREACRRVRGARAAHRDEIFVAFNAIARDLRSGRVTEFDCDLITAE